MDVSLLEILYQKQDEDIKPPDATPQSQIVHNPDDILTVVQVDTLLYRSKLS